MPPATAGLCLPAAARPVLLTLTGGQSSGRVASRPTDACAEQGSHLWHLKEDVTCRTGSRTRTPDLYLSLWMTETGVRLPGSETLTFTNSLIWRTQKRRPRFGTRPAEFTRSFPGGARLPEALAVWPWRCVRRGCGRWSAPSACSAHGAPWPGRSAGTTGRLVQLLQRMAAWLAAAP